MGEVESSDDGLILSLVVGGLEPKSECILNIYSFWGGQNYPNTAPLSIGGPVYRKLPNGEVGVARVSSASSTEVNSVKKFAKTYPFIAVCCLYLMSKSLDSKADFINLPEVFGLCSTCFIGYSVGTSMV